MENIRYIVRQNEPFRGFVYDVVKDATNVDLTKFKVLDEAEYLSLVDNFIKELQEPFKEISEEHFNDMLNVLPPAKWRRGANKESFFVPEAYYANLYTLCVRYGDRYFSAIRSINISENEIYSELKDICE